MRLAYPRPAALQPPYPARTDRPASKWTRPARGSTVSASISADREVGDEKVRRTRPAAAADRRRGRGVLGRRRSRCPGGEPRAEPWLRDRLFRRPVQLELGP